jgi:hypothetical protein
MFILKRMGRHYGALVTNLAALGNLRPACKLNAGVAPVLSILV